MSKTGRILKKENVSLFVAVTLALIAVLVIAHI